MIKIPQKNHKICKSYKKKLQENLQSTKKIIREFKNYKKITKPKKNPKKEHVYIYP